MCVKLNNIYIKPNIYIAYYEQKRRQKKYVN